MEIAGDLKSPDLLEHIKDSHKDIYQVHKDNPDGTVGFRVEFLHLNVLKDDDTIETKMEPVILAAEECEAMESVVVEEAQETQDQDTEVVNMQYVMLDNKRKKSSSGNEDRRRSWIWKYFDKLSNIVYRCNICNVVLSIKGCNTNNLNRHMRSKHPDTFKVEKFGDLESKGREDKMLHGLDSSYTDKSDDISYVTNTSGQSDSPSQKLRRSWIWSYFDHVSSTQAQCKLCRRFINHGGNATGNMNRHLKMIHHKTACDNHWVWKVFDRDQPFYSCKICQHKLNKKNTESDMVAIIYHLKKTHGVVSGDQIITGSECSALNEG